MRCVPQKHGDPAYLASFTTAATGKSNATRDFLSQAISFLMWNMPCPKRTGGMMLGEKDAWTERLHLSAKQNTEPSRTDVWVHGCLCPVWGTEAAGGRPYLR